MHRLVSSEGLTTTALPDGQRRRRLPAQQHVREVERQDDADDAHRLLDRVVELALRSRRTHDVAHVVAADLGVVVDRGDAPLDLVGALLVGLAHLPGEHLREHRLDLLDGAADLVQLLRPVQGRLGPPQLLRQPERHREPRRPLRAGSRRRARAAAPLAGSWLG